MPRERRSILVKQADDRIRKQIDTIGEALVFEEEVDGEMLGALNRATASAKIEVRRLMDTLRVDIEDDLEGDTDLNADRMAKSLIEAGDTSPVLEAMADEMQRLADKVRGNGTARAADYDDASVALQGLLALLIQKGLA